jgi:undecaprenyl diphosphate synthase
MVEIKKFMLLSGKEKKLPNHVALSTSAIKSWADDKKKELKDVISRHFQLIDELIDYQVKNKIRVLTINLTDSSSEVVSATKDYFIKLCDDERVNKNQMRVFVIGQWYGLDSELSDIFKLSMEKTKIYDNFFLNFCVNYDGREELLGSLRIMNRKLSAGKLKEEQISETLIKENLYSSYFPPPELIIETSKSYSGLLLWDSKGALLYFSEKRWPLFDLGDFEEAINFYDGHATNE